MGKILNFGSLNIDHVYGVEHFVQPGETEAASDAALLPGGKGLNQAAALARAGAEVYLAGKIGRDGEWLAQLLGQYGVNTDYLGRDSGLTGTAFIQVTPNGQNSILIDRGANGRIDEAFADSVLSHFGEGDILLIQNEISSLAYIITRAAERGMTIALNPSPVNKAVLAAPLEKVTYFILNEIEGASLSGEHEFRKIPEALLRVYPEAKIILTLGKNGVIYHDRQKTAVRGIYRVPIVDTTGAGDTFAGFFLARVAAGDSVEEALRLASVASSLEVSRKGAAVAVPTLAEVREAKSEYVPPRV